mgnify:CR=1 FL=1
MKSHDSLNRRKLLLAAGAAVGGGAVIGNSMISAAKPELQPENTSDFPVRFALNMSTIRGQDLPVDKQIQVAADAGYDGIEPWIGDLKKYVSGGGKLTTLRSQIDDAGMTVDSAIGFAKWISNDESTRRSALEEAKRDMEMVRQIGGSRIAAPPSGASKNANEIPTLDVIAQRYRALLDVGAETGVVPQLELWGHSKAISRLSELAYIAVAAEHPDACVLPDFYHIYKGGSDFAGLGMIEASRIHCFHINDYPAEPALAEIRDQHRVFPGDGICDLPGIIRQLVDNGFRGAFSLELFNRDYWKRDAQQVANEGLKKSKAVVESALS